MYDVSDKAVNTKKNAVKIEKISASNMTKQKYDDSTNYASCNLIGMLVIWPGSFGCLCNKGI